MGTNTTYLSNAVNQIFGCNLKSLLNWYRVQYAKRMLTCYTYKLKDIPFICGFSSKSTFYVAFRKYEGITPYQYVLERRPDRLEELEEVPDERTSKITAQPGLPSSQYAHT